VSYIVVRDDGTYLRWIFNQGLRADKTPVADFMHWSPDISKAKTWKTPLPPTYIVALHGGMRVNEVKTELVENVTVMENTTLCE
jgi:hypothetical protein